MLRHQPLVGLAGQLRVTANASSTFARNPAAQRITMRRPPFDIWVHDPASCLISRALLRERAWEDRELMVVLAALLGGPPGGFFLDIGANLGVYALSAAAAGVPAVAIEPLTFNIELLAASARRLDPRRAPLLAVHAAVAATPSAVPACVRAFDTQATKAAANAGNGQVAHAGASCAAGEVVTLTTVDAVLQSDPMLRRVCFTALKVDVEGFEAAALRGAGGVLGGGCPPCLVFLETQPAIAAAAGSDSKEVFGVLRGFGYECRSIVLKKREPRDFACWRPRPTRRCREPVAAAMACLATAGHRLCKSFVDHAVTVRTGVRPPSPG